ncbi:MAG: hypothetical protein KGV44_08410 [Flavobacteriaceae bacterium]|nr:hypothetical protein [Flavobacteriaceae bacterium]
MNIQTRKIEFVQAFLQLQNEELISRFEELLYKGKKNESKFEPMSVGEFNRRINISLSDSKNDRVIESSKLMSEIEQWS